MCSFCSKCKNVCGFVGIERMRCQFMGHEHINKTGYSICCGQVQLSFPNCAVFMAFLDIFEHDLFLLQVRMWTVGVQQKLVSG